MQGPLAPVPHRVAPAGPGREHQRRPPVLQRQPRVGPGPGEDPHEVGFGELGGQGEGGRPEQVLADHQHLAVAGDLRGQRHLGVRARAVRQKRFDDLDVARQHRRVQGGVAGARGVGVGAPVEQQEHHLAVAAVRRHHQGAGTVGGGVVDVGPGVEQPARHLDVAVARREQQRREPADPRLLGVGAVAAPELAVAQLGLQPPADDEPARARPGPHVGAAVEQKLHHVGVALRRRPHQRGLVFEQLAPVDVRAGVQEPPHRVDVPGAGAGHEDGLAGLDRRVGVGAGREQQLDQAGAAVAAGEGQRGDPQVVGGRGVSTGVRQPARRLQIVVIGGPVQRGRAIGLGRVHVDAVLRPARRVQEGGDRGGLLMLDGVDQPQVGTLGGDTGDRER